jgi:hypothetical protein
MAPSSPRNRPHRDPIAPDRIRTVDRHGFAFVPNRFLHDGFLAALDHTELALYVFLVLAADRNGVSFYGYERICTLLRLPLERYVEVRNSLIRKDLLAFDGTRFQVLSLPPHPVTDPSKALQTPQDFEDLDPATIRLLVSQALK